MLNKEIGRLRLKLYGGVNELPSDRYNKFNIYCMLRAGVGNDAESILAHMQDLFASMARKDYDRTITHLNNYYHSLNMILNHEDTQNMAFACLVHSINEVEVTDITDEGLRRTVERVAKAEKRVQALQLFEVLKKKLRLRLKSIFLRR